MKKLITLLLIVLSVNIYSQEKVILDGKEYLMHKVKRKETLYGICKKYDVNAEQINAANPNLIHGLKKGQLIKIPVVAKEVAKTDDKNTHTVLQGETVYGIAKKYGISVDKLVDANLGKTSNLKPGDKLIIPGKKAEKQPVKPIVKGRIVEHKVKAKETLYGISRNYGTSVEEITKLNKELVEAGIKEGDVLKIRTKSDLKSAPLKVEAAKLPKDANFAKVTKVNPLKDKLDKMVMKDSYNMTLLLPFMLDKNETIQKNRKPTDPKRMYQLTEMSTHFYQGVKLALDTAQAAGVSINLNVYDTKKDTGHLAKVLRKEEVKNSDVIIGPLYEKTYAKATAFAKANQVQLVCPVDQSNKSLFNNPFVTKLKASLPTQSKYLASYIANNFNTENVIVVTGKTKKDKYLAEVFTTNYNELIKSKTNNYKSEASVFKFISYKDMSGMKAKLIESKKNIIIFPTTDLGLAASFFTQLNVEMNKTGMHKHEVSVFALENFLSKGYDNINVDHKIKYNLHVTSSKFINYEDEKVKSFILKYRKEFGTDPNEFAFMGYDATLFHAMGLKAFGKSYAHNYDYVQIPLLQSEYKLSRTDDGSGFENTKVYIISYADYQLNKVE